MNGKSLESLRNAKFRATQNIYEVYVKDVKGDQITVGYVIGEDKVDELATHIFETIEKGKKTIDIRSFTWWNGR